MTTHSKLIDSKIPCHLPYLLSIHDHGENIKRQTQLNNTSTTTVDLTISHLLVFNSVKHAWNVEKISVRHGCERETPLALYLPSRFTL